MRTANLLWLVPLPSPLSPRFPVTSPRSISAWQLPRHGASCPVGIGVSCSADRQALGKITKEGVFLESLERDVGKYLPEVGEGQISHEVGKKRSGSSSAESFDPDLCRFIKGPRWADNVRLAREFTVQVARTASH